MRLDELWQADREEKLDAVVAVHPLRLSRLEPGNDRAVPGWQQRVVPQYGDRDCLGGQAGRGLGHLSGYHRAQAAEEALRESEARYRQFLQISVEGIWRLECPPISTSLDERQQAELMLQQARVAESNEAMARRFGYASAEEMVGVYIRDLWQAAEEAKLGALVQFVRSGYRISDLEVEGPTRMGAGGTSS